MATVSLLYTSSVMETFNKSTYQQNASDLTAVWYEEIDIHEQSEKNGDEDRTAVPFIFL